MGAVESSLYSLGEHPFKKTRVPNTGVIVAAASMKDGIEGIVLPKILQVVGSKDIVKIKNNAQGMPCMILWRTGSITHLMSAEQDDIVFEGKTIDWAWLDEPSRRNIFVALKRGMLTTGGHLWYTCTPLDEPWLYEEIYCKGIDGSDPSIECFEGSSDENDRITKEEKDEFRSRLTEDEIQARWYGKFSHLAGRVFKEYNPERHRITPFDIPRHWPTWVSIDPHRNKPHAVNYLAIAPDQRKYMCNEIYTKADPRSLAGYVKDIGSQYNIVEKLIDTSAQEDGWEKQSLRSKLEDYGVRTKLAQKKNKKASRIVLINQAFKDDELFIFDTCVRTHRELTNQTYKKNKRDEQQVLEEPEKKWDDCTDNMGYIFTENPRYQGVAVIQEHGGSFQKTR